MHFLLVGSTECTVLLSFGAYELFGYFGILCCLFTVEQRLNAVDESTEFLEYAKAGDLENIQVLG